MLLLVRHAWAGERNEWEGHDRVRPLDDRGRAQALALVGLLRDRKVGRILSSPYHRCVQTVEPLAATRALPVERRDELGEERQDVDGAALVRSLAGEAAVVCGHGGLLQAVLARDVRWRKGEVAVLDERLGLVGTFRA